MPAKVLTALLRNLKQDKAVFSEEYQAMCIEMRQLKSQIRNISKILEQEPYLLIQQTIIQYIQRGEKPTLKTWCDLVSDLDEFMILNMTRLEMLTYKKLTLFFNSDIRCPTHEAYKDKIALLKLTFQAVYPALFDDSRITPSALPIHHEASSSFSSQGISPTCDVSLSLVAVTTLPQVEKAADNAPFDTFQPHSFFSVSTPPDDSNILNSPKI